MKTTQPPVSVTAEPDPVRNFLAPDGNLPYGSSITYKDADLAKFQGALAVARKMAIVDAEAVRKGEGDRGTCVLGAGITIKYLAPRKRKPEKLTLIRAPFQGNIAQYQACKRAAQYLRSQGLDCYWYDGVMD